MALQKIKFKKDINPMKILAQISAVEVKSKQSLNKEKKAEVVQGCVGDDYAQIIVVTDKVAWIELKQNGTALELCKAMKQAWCIKGHNNDDEEDNDVNNQHGVGNLARHSQGQAKLDREAKMLLKREDRTQVC